MNIPYLAFQVAAAHDRLWAINPKRAEALAALFVASPEAFTRGMGASEREDEPAPEGIALIPFHGVMSRAGMPCMESASTVDLQRSIRAASKDDSINAIVLDIDSPGGTVAGTADLADLVKSVSRVKPVYAYTADTVCSAAYWVASQATEIWASPNAMSIGNIGVRASSADTTKAYEAEGVQMRHYATGAYKAIGAEGVPIPEEHHDEMQRLVDEQGAKFFSAVKSGRNLSDDQLSAVTDGRWFTADVAKQNGLIDQIGSIQDLFSTISIRQAAKPAWQLSPAARPAASAPTPNKTMSKLSEFFANLRSNPEAAKAAGMPDAASIDALEAEANATPTTTALDPTVASQIQAIQTASDAALAAASAQMAAVASGLLDTRAESFATGLINDRKAHGAQRESLKSLYRTAALADGGGIAKIDANGALVEGQNVEAVKSAWKDAPQHQHGSDTIPDADPTRNAEATTSEATRTKLLKMTPQGQAALAAKERN